MRAGRVALTVSVRRAAAVDFGGGCGEE